MNVSRIAMTRAEMAQGRLMRGPDHPGGDGGGGNTGGDSGKGVDNGGGNTPTPSSDSGGGDNPGQEFDPSSFWNDPKQENSDPANQQPNQNNPEDSDPGREIGQRIANGIKDFKFDPVFTEQIGNELAEGRMDGANESFANMTRQAMQQSVVMSAQIMEHLGTQIMAQVKEMVDGRLGQEKNDESLLESFPGMKNPAMKPVIQGVFGQAMKHSGGNRDKALELTRNMLKAMGQSGRQDMGIEDPAPDPDSFMGDGPSQLVKDLLSR